MKITEVSVRTAPFSSNTWLDTQRVSTPMSWVPEYAARRSSWRGPGSDVVWVLLRTDDPAVFGVGQSRGGAVTASLIEEHLSRFLVGREASGISARVYEMQSAALPYADGGLAAMAVSAVELALWDLTARAAGVPLVDLLGGRAGEPRHYLTVPHLDMFDAIDPAMLDSAVTVKIPAAAGPADGRRGLDRMLADVAAVRERVPDHVSVSVDCFMSWDVPFTVEFARRAAGAGIGWIEEPLRPRDFAGYADLARMLPPAMVAGGEHLFGLQDGARFIVDRCAHLLQVDVTWCGGLGVATTLGRLAVDAGMTFAPHAAALQPWSVHLVAAFGPGVLLEILTGIDPVSEIPVPAATPGVGIDPASVGFS